MDRPASLNLQDHFDNIADAYYGIVDRIWYDIGYYHRREAAFLQEQFRQRVKLAVDIGCGPGGYLATLSAHAHKVIAIDFSRLMLEKARERIRHLGNAGVDFIQADVKHLPLRDRVADFVLNLEVLEHLPGSLDDAQTLLEEFERILRTDGNVLIEVPLRRHLWWKHLYSREATYRELSDDDRSRYYEKFPLLVDYLFRDEDLDRILRLSGFQCERKCYIGFFPSGLIERHPSLGKLGEVLEGFPILNRVCREAMWYARLEARHQGENLHMIVRKSSIKFHRVLSSALLLPAWFAPSAPLRAAFHRARGVQIGPNVEIGYFVILDNLYPRKVVLEANVTVAARSTILAHDESRAYTGTGAEVVKETRVKEGAFIGVHVVILPGVTVGRRAIVGAGSVVADDVPDSARVAGVPARLLMSSTQSG